MIIDGVLGSFVAGLFVHTLLYIMLADGTESDNLILSQFNVQTPQGCSVSLNFFYSFPFEHVRSLHMQKRILVQKYVSARRCVGLTYSATHTSIVH
jgi:hypothetical protein